MKHSKRPYEEAFHHGSTPLDSSVKKAEPTAASAPVVSPAQFNSSPLPAGGILLSTSLVTVSQPHGEVGPDPGPQPDDGSKVQTIASDSEGIEITTELPGEPLPSNTTQARLPLQATPGGRFAADEDASIGAPHGSSGSNLMDFEEIPPSDLAQLALLLQAPNPPPAAEVLLPAPPVTASRPLTKASSNLTQPTLPLQTPGEIELPAAGHVNTDKSTLGSNLEGLSGARFFENASNFSVNNPIMGEHIQITQVQMPDGAVLKEMVEHVIPGAQYDSSARDSPPRCHPGTRIKILEDVQARIHSPDLATRMVWIYGPAGVGKSAIMQTLAEAEASRGGIFTTLFFSRPNERDDPRKAFTTLAYSLAVHSLDYQRYIGQRLKGDPMFLTKTLNDQFQQLFVTPFLTPFTKGHIDFGSQRWVIFLDGLDECSGEAEQRRIVELIRKSMLHCAVSSPFIWVIASRPEAHLKMEFARAKADVTSFWELEVPIDSDDSLRDVEHYLHTQFSKMREDLPDSIPPLWPSESAFTKLSEASSGLFIFASTLIAYLLGGDPVSRLKYIIPLIMAARAQTVDPKRNPFRVLDLLYTQIMSDVPGEVLSTTKLLLGIPLLSPSLKIPPMSLLLASNIMKLEQYEVYAALRKLQSVLDFPSSQEAGNRSIRFLHASFSDFLLDPARSQTYFIGFNKEARSLWGYCADVLHQYETHHTYTRVNLTWSPSGADSAALQEAVFQTARKTLIQTLQNYGRQTSKGALITDNASLLKALQSLGPSIFKGGTRKAVNFLYWLSTDAPPEVIREFVKTFPLLDLNINQLFKSLCAQRWCYRLLNKEVFHDVGLGALAEFGASEWRQAQDALWNESGVFRRIVRQNDSSVQVQQLGFEGTRQCVVIGPVYSSSFQASHYIFPFFDEQAES